MDLLRRLVSSCAKATATPRRRPHSQFRRGWEPLEDRLLMAAYVVNSLADGAPIADGQLTLREAILAADTNAPSGDAPAGSATLDTIRFDFSTFSGTIALNAAQGDLDITSGGDLSIIGPDNTNPAGIIISGQNAIRGFFINQLASRVTISNLTVSNGGNIQSGGGIWNRGPNTTLRNVAVTNCSATFGGGVANGPGALTIEDSLISGNATDSSGGGVYNRDGNVTVIRSEISGNSTTGSGGGLQNQQSAGVLGVTMTIIDSLISGNQSVNGGVSSQSEGLTLNIQGSTIVGNTGGGVRASGAATIVNSTIANNWSESPGGGVSFSGSTASTMTIVNTTIVGNSDTSNISFNGGSTGGIHAVGSEIINMSNSIVSLNNAVDGRVDNVELAELDTNVNNFIGGNPKLGPLKDNGGPTPTMQPLPGSPVINAGSNAAATNAGLKRDQRGFGRFVNGDASSILVDIGAVELTPLPAPIVVGADAGGGPHVKVYLPDGSVRFSFFAYNSGFTGGVRVATGDVSGDGVADIITAPGPGGGPHVLVFDGVNGSIIRSFFAYNAGFTGGVYLAAGDVNDDGLADIITGSGPGGGPHVRVFNAGQGGNELVGFFAYDAGFRGGVRVAAGDLNGDGRADIITAAGPTGGPHVKAFSGANVGIVLQSFFAFDGAFTGGVYVAAGDVNGDGQVDIIASAGEGGSPMVRVFDGANASVVLLDFLAYAQNFTGGVRVGAVDRNGDGRADLLTAAGPGGGPHVRTFDGLNAAQLDNFFAFDAAFQGGIWIG